MIRHKHFWLGIGAIALVALPAFGQSAPDTFSTVVSADGAIRVPENYQENMVFIGTWAIRSNDQSVGVKGFHNVFMPRDAVQAYRQTGEFPDGAVIVKELLSAATGTKTTGDIAWAGDITGWFVMVKDREGRFPDNPLWGNGWGWSYFNPDDPAKTVSTGFRQDCLGCHIPAKKTDWIFMDGYPSLIQKE